MPEDFVKNKRITKYNLEVLVFNEFTSTEMRDIRIQAFLRWLKYENKLSMLNIANHPWYKRTVLVLQLVFYKVGTKAKKKM